MTYGYTPSGSKDENSVTEARTAVVHRPYVDIQVRTTFKRLHSQEEESLEDVLFSHAYASMQPNVPVVMHSRFPVCYTGSMRESRSWHSDDEAKRMQSAAFFCLPD